MFTVKSDHVYHFEKFIIKYFTTLNKILHRFLIQFLLGNIFKKTFHICKWSHFRGISGKAMLFVALV